MMTVRRNRLLGITFLILGGIYLFLGGLLSLIEHEIQMYLVLGVFFFLLGPLYLSRPYFIVESNAIVIPAKVGPLKRTIPYTSLTVLDGEVIAEHNGQTRRVPVSRWMSQREDWDALRERFSSNS